MDRGGSVPGTRTVRWQPVWNAQDLRGQGHGAGPGCAAGHRDPGRGAGEAEAARDGAHLRGSPQLGGAGAAAHRTGYRGHGEGEIPPGPGQGGVCSRQGF